MIMLDDNVVCSSLVSIGVSRVCRDKFGIVMKISLKTNQNSYHVIFIMVM